MLSTFNRNKSKLLLATLATGLGVHLHSLAQAANDSGSLTINGQISNTTCVLDLGDGGSTAAGSRTLNLGTYTVSTAAAATGAGTTFGTPATAIFSLKNANGTECTFTNATRWDIGVNLAANQIFSTGSNVLLLSTGASANASQNLGVLLRSSVGANPTVGATNLNLAQSVAPFGTLLSGSTTTTLGVSGSGNRIALTAQFARTSATSAPTAGAFSATIPLNVWYQ
jgi:hypothetical protein